MYSDVVLHPTSTGSDISHVGLHHIWVDWRRATTVQAYRFTAVVRLRTVDRHRAVDRNRAVDRLRTVDRLRAVERLRTVDWLRQ